MILRLAKIAKKGANFEGAVEMTMAGMGRLKRICKDAVRVASAVEETPTSEMLDGHLIS